jgi:hypothetical protein
MICFVGLAVFLILLCEINNIDIPPGIEIKYVPWKNYDWFPAKQPYETPGMS